MREMDDKVKGDKNEEIMFVVLRNKVIFVEDFSNCLIEWLWEFIKRKGEIVEIFRNKNGG